MDNQSGLCSLLTLKNTQRLSIADIHSRWNDELHYKAGCTRYQPKLEVAQQNKNPSNISTSIDKAKGVSIGIPGFVSAMEDLLNRGKWVRHDGSFAQDEQINKQLGDLIKRGNLRAFISMDSSVAACQPAELAKINLLKDASKYFIDRDDLGCFLISVNKPLPQFWYNADDTQIYRDRLAREDATLKDVRSQLAEVLKENDELKRQLMNAMPFMNPAHPFFSPELEASVTAWLEHYSQKSAGHMVAKKPKLEQWIKDNRAQAVCQPNGEISKSALERIVMVVNPDKQGGRPTK